MSTSGLKDSSRKDSFDTSTSATDKDKTFNAEVERICKKGMPSPADTIELYNKYPNDERLVGEILRACTKKYIHILKKARKVAEKVKVKFETGMRPLHEILDKMIRYKRDNKWSDAQYEIFKNELTKILSPKQAYEIDYNQEIIMNRSRINRTLGYRKIEEGTLKIKESEHAILAEILSMHDTTLALYNSNMMSSLTYNDCDLPAMTGAFTRGKHIPSNHIHPIIACMFLPKFEIFEYHMLYSNIGRIIKCRNEGKPVMTEPDALLYQDMIIDPNDVVCDTNSPITDLRNRYRVQIKLWKTVQQLRNGIYYEDSPISEFITALNACRNNLYDNADLAYNQDEGSIMRRILSVFSLRPILIATKPLQVLAGFLGTGPMGYGMSGSPLSFNNQPVHTITSIPMITVQLPFKTKSDMDMDINLENGLTQTIWINENKTIVPKEQKFIYSREVCIFYVNRRIQSIQIKTFMNPLQFSQLPLTLNSSSRINTYPVDVPPSFYQENKDDAYILRSVVAVTDTKIIQSGRESSIITGCVGLITQPRNIETGIYDDKCYRYDPLGAAIPIQKDDGHILKKFNFGTDDDSEQEGFDQIARTRGTIFIYSKSSGYTRNNSVIDVYN